MNPVLRNVLAVIAGLLIGGFVNGLTLSISMNLFPPPEGVDLDNLESIKANLHRYSVAQLLVPFWAHALGTLIGALVTALIAATKKMGLALLIGTVFLLSGLYMVYIVGGPPWFIVLDLLIAYLPMAFIGGRAAIAIKNR